MKKSVELPLVDPIFSTYQFHACGAVAIHNNPSIRNWYLNQSVILSCNRKFLNGYTSPGIDIDGAKLYDNPHFEKYTYDMQFTKGYINPIIRELIDNGYYVYFKGIDDYYVEGKSWYQKRHMNHDGLICGYDQNKKTYYIYSYDSNWICRKYETSQSSFNAGRKSMIANGVDGYICGIKPKKEIVEYDPYAVIDNLSTYLNSTFDNYPINGEGRIRGIIVHDYIAIYLDKLYNGLVPYERMDPRVFRLIWEHKKAMLERIEKMEETLRINNFHSIKYAPIVSVANDMRMMYASHHAKRRDSLLPVIQQKLLELREMENIILSDFWSESKGAITK